MKPKEQKPEEIYRVMDRETGTVQGAYSRAYCTEYDFDSVDEARRSLCSGAYQDRAKYRVAKYRVIYELIDEDVDPPTDEEKALAEAEAKRLAAMEEEMDALRIPQGVERAAFVAGRAMDDIVLDAVFKERFVIEDV